MSISVNSQRSGRLTLTVEFDLSGSILEMEERIQETLNEAGRLATKSGLEMRDTDGSPISFGDTKFYSKGRSEKRYQTPYGAVNIGRHTYQSAKGGKTYCPVESSCRIIAQSTPLLAKQVSFKMAEMPAAAVMRDFTESHGRKISKCLVQDLSTTVATISQLAEEKWEYDLPELKEPVESVSVSLDGTMILTVDSGWREAMVGAISFYSKKGERLHTTYTAASPEYGKKQFFERLEREIVRAKSVHSDNDADYVGIADGARGNWGFLSKHTSVQITDFFHASEYINKAAEAGFSKSKNSGEKQEWVETVLHDLKHKPRGVSTAIRKLKDLETTLSEKSEQRRAIESSRKYFENQKSRMSYASYLEKGFPIGSGVTEAACKMVVKQRLCQSGMRWRDEGAASVLSLRCLNRTDGRWAQFWRRIDVQGVLAGINDL